MLFEPSARVVSEVGRRNARLLSMILLTVTLSNLSGAIYTPEHLHLVRSMMAYVVGPLFLLYLLSRTRYYLPAAVMAISILMLTPYVSLSNLPVYSMSTIAENIMWLLLPMFVAVITLPMWLGVGFLGANFLVLLSMPAWVTGFEYRHLGNGLSFVVIASILLLVVAAIRKRDVDELHQNAVELRRQKEWLEQEIEERHQMEMELGSLQNLINSINEAVVLVSGQGRIERVNETCCSMFGFRRERMLNQHINGLLVENTHSGQHVQLFPSLINTQNREDVSWFGFQAMRQDGSEFPAEAHAAKIEIGEQYHYVVTIRDVTEHKLAEMVKDEFVSSVSHELRTPLTSIYGAISIIKGRYQNALDEKLQNLIDIAYENSTALTRLVEDILDISRLEAGRLQIEYDKYTLDGLLREVLKNYRPVEDKYSVHFRLVEGSTDIHFETDKKYFTQVMNNLLSNAAKFSPRDSEVDISYGLEGDTVQVLVTDYGSGIPKEYQCKIFDKFYQIESTNKQSRSGTGLGLSICRKILEQMGGRIGVESEPGRTQFKIEIPRQGLA